MITVKSGIFCFFADEIARRNWILSTGGMMPYFIVKQTAFGSDKYSRIK